MPATEKDEVFKRRLKEMGLDDDSETLPGDCLTEILLSAVAGLEGRYEKLWQTYQVLRELFKVLQVGVYKLPSQSS